MAYVTVQVQRNYLQEDGTYLAKPPYSIVGHNSLDTNGLTLDEYRQEFEETKRGIVEHNPFVFPADDYITLDDGWQLQPHDKPAFYYAYPSDETDDPSYVPHAANAEIEWTNNNSRIIIKLWACKTDDTLVKFGTLTRMFGTYKQKSDAALDAKLSQLPAGGVDQEALDAAMDARLAEYTTERDQAVSNAVGAAKTELRGEMPKPFDFVDNNDDGGYLRMKNIAPYAISDAEGVSGNEYIPVCLWRRNAGNNPQGLLLVEKAQVNALIDAKLAEVRKAVEGVVLYESDDPSKGVDVSLPDLDVSGYERISVEVMCHAATGLSGSVSPCVVDIPAAEFAWLSASTSSWVMRPYVVALNRAAASERYLLMNLRARHAAPASRSGLRVVPDFGEGGLILAPGSAPQSLDDANVRDSATGTATYVRRIVGYPRLPEVV